MKSGRERRQHERRPISEKADLTVLGNVSDWRECLAEPEQTADVVAASEKGLRLITNYPLKPGNLIKLNNIDDSKNNIGVVMWTVTSESMCKAEVFLMELPQYE